MPGYVEKKDQHIYLFYFSICVLQALRKLPQSDNAELISKILSQIQTQHDIHLYWIPSHAGIYYNEIADRIAVRAKLAGEPIHMFVVVNFDALAQARDFRIERRQVVFLHWMQYSNQGLWNRISCRLNANWQTDWAIQDQAKNLNSIAHPYDHREFVPLVPTAGWLSNIHTAEQEQFQ